MNEAVIFQSPHAIKPEIYLTKAEREERYRTRLDETFRPYTVLDVLTRVYRHRPEDDLDEALGKNLGAFVSLEGGNSVSRAWVADCRIIRVETLFSSRWMIFWWSCAFRRTFAWRSCAVESRM